MAEKINDILKGIKKDSLKPIYFLHGDEPYFIEAIADKIQDIAIPVHEKGFNEFLLFGKDLTVGGVLNYARRYPMMADRQLILVKDAHQIQGIDLKENQTLLEDYALKPLTTTILVLCFGNAQDERKTWVKAQSRNGFVYSAKKLYENQIPDFISDFCHSKGVKISPKAIQLLVEHIGNDLKRLTSEIDKVILNLKIDEGIDADAIQRYVGISKEYNVFELQKALIIRDVLKANQIINYFASNTKDNPIQPILIILYNFFSKVLFVHGLSDKSEGSIASNLKINMFFAKDYAGAVRNYPIGKVAQIIHHLRIADAKSKGVEVGNDGEGEILKQLVFQILH